MDCMLLSVFLVVMKAISVVHQNRPLCFQSRSSFGYLLNIQVSVTIRGPNKGKLSGNPLGKNPSDV